MDHHIESAASTDLRHRLRTSALISRMADEPLPRLTSLHSGVALMPEPTLSVAGGLLAKLLPAGLGATIMVLVDPPESKRELFWRIFVAFVASYLFGDVIFDLLHSISLFAFLDHTKRAHTIAVEGIVGAFGWSALGGISMWLRRFRTDPVQAVREVKG